MSIFIKFPHLDVVSFPKRNSQKPIQTLNFTLKNMTIEQGLPISLCLCKKCATLMYIIYQEIKLWTKLAERPIKEVSNDANNIAKSKTE